LGLSRNAPGIGGCPMEMALGRFGDRRLEKGGGVLEGMVRAGSTCLRRVADGKRRSEVQFNRFLANPKVTVERLVAGWGATTGAAVAGRHVLAIQDTSEINFRTTKARTRGLGEIGKGVGRGALLHAMVAVDAESEAEPDPPQRSEPITWRRLTTHAVSTAAAAWQIVDWYRARWIIE